MQAAVTVYNGQAAFHFVGTIRREYAKGLTVEDERGVIHYATFERVQRLAQPQDNAPAGQGDMLW